MTDVKCSCYDRTEGSPSDTNYADESNVIYDSAKPLFVDAANGDYRVAAGSQLKNKMPAQTWMGDGSKRSQKDLGSGYEIAVVGKYGVTVNRVNAVPRLYGTMADIGCCEYWIPNGLMLIIK